MAPPRKFPVLPSSKTCSFRPAARRRSGHVDSPLGVSCRGRVDNLRLQHRTATRARVGGLPAVAGGRRSCRSIRLSSEHPPLLAAARSSP
eukprot:6464646-Prymnesium_polylepis.1